MNLQNPSTRQYRETESPFYSPDKMAGHKSRLLSSSRKSSAISSADTLAHETAHSGPSSISRKQVSTGSMPSRLSVKTILLADVDLEVRISVKNLLVNEGYAVILAPDGQQALDLTDEVPVDLVLLDLNTPDKDGWDTFEEITRRQPATPVIVMTARPNQLFTAVCAGAGALLEKPLNAEILLTTIEKLLLESPEQRLGRLVGLNKQFHFSPSGKTPHLPDGPEAVNKWGGLD